MHEEPVSQPAVAGIGEMLKAAREKRGTTLAEAAEKLRVDVGVLEALEGERFASLGAPVYARGHLRRYADLLGEPFEPLMALFAGHDASSVQPDLTRAPRITDWRPPRVRSPRAPRRKGWRLVAALVLLGVAGVLWWGLVAKATP
jgi:cytoskeleton protein RodZ